MARLDDDDDALVVMVTVPVQRVQMTKAIVSTFPKMMTGWFTEM